MNCWEFKKCGHEENGGCPAYPNKGKTCFFVAGTLCKGEVQGDYARKIQSCRTDCDFYRYIMDKVK